MAVENDEKSSSSNSYGSLSPQEIENIKHHISDKKELLIFNLFSELGVTVSELVDLRVPQIDFSSRKLFLKDRVLTFSEILLQQLRAYVKENSPSDFLFFTRQSPKITPRRVQQILKQVSQRSGIEVTPSSLRRAAVSKRLHEHIPVDEIKDFFGFKQLRKKDFLTEDEFRRLYSSISSERDGLLVSLLYETGMTPSQLKELKVDHIDISARTIRLLPDNRFSEQKFRVAKISKELAGRISGFVREYPRQFSSYLFFTRQSSQLSERRIQQLLRKYSEAAGLSEVTSTVLRNTCIAHTISARGISSASAEFGFSAFRLYEYGQLSFAAAGRISGTDSSRDGGKHG